MAIGKVGKNGTLNENGTFYSVQDVNTLLENVGGGGDLPEPTVADAGSVVVVDAEGKYALGEAGSDLPVPSSDNVGKFLTVIGVNPYEFEYGFESVKNPLFIPITINASSADGTYTTGISIHGGSWSPSDVLNMGYYGFDTENIVFKITLNEDDGEDVYTMRMNVSDYFMSGDTSLVVPFNLMSSSQSSPYINITHYEIDVLKSPTPTIKYTKSSYRVSKYTQ